MEKLNQIKIAVLLGVFFLTACVMAESASVLLEEGIYAEQTEGDLDKAIAIYTQITEQHQDNERVAARATYQLGMCHLKMGDKAKAAEYFRQVVSDYPDQEEISEQAKEQYSKIYPGQEIVERSVTVARPAVDPAKLMPADTLIYFELGSPGRQIETIVNMLKGTPLENPFALIGGGNGGKSPGNMLGAFFNPSMLAEFKKIRGSAFGITGLAQNNPPFVGLLDPGESDALRGLIMAGLGAAGTRGEPIEGMEALIIEKQIGVAYDEQVIIIAQPLEQLRWSVRQYKGITDEPTLASENKYFSRIDKKARQDNAVTIWADVDKAFVGVKNLIGEQELPQEFRMADYFADFENIDELVSYVSIEPSGISTEVDIDFKGGHRCLVYDMIRTPHISKSVLSAAPGRSAAVLSFAMDESKGAVVERAQKAIGNLTGLDIGREIFANIEQMTIFVSSPEKGADIPEGSVPVLPGVGLAITSHNPQQTRQLFDRFLRGAEVATAESPSEHSTGQIAGVDKYMLKLDDDAQVQCYMAQSGKTTVVAFGADALEASLSALKGKDSVVKSGAIGEAISQMPDDTSKLMMVNIGQAIRLADAYRVIPYDDANETAREAVAKLARAFDGTCIQARTREIANHFNMHASIKGFPPVDEVYGPMMQLVEMARKVQAKARADKAKAEIGATIIKTDKGPVIDGEAEDIWLRAREYELKNVIYSPVSSPNDFAANFKTMWDEENLYMFVDVTDDELENYTDQWYLDDCIEVFIDADNSKSENFGDNDYQYHFDWDASNPQMDEAKHHKIEGVEFAMVTTEKGYRTEIKFPWSTLGTKPSAGVKIGFEVHVNDDDDGERTKLSWRGKSDVASGNPQTWGTADLAGLLGWWKFDNNTEDSSGTGNHGTVNGDPNWVAGQIGDALEFDGIDDYVQIPDDKAVLELTGDYTFSVWVKADATQKSWASIFSKCDPSGSINHWTLQFDTSSPKNLLIHHPDPGFWNTGIRLPDIAGATHHIGIVRSGNIMTSYLDGVPRNTGTWNNNPGSGHGHLNIGADRTAMPDCVYKGLIDDVRIYNYVLSDAEIKALANK